MLLMNYTIILLYGLLIFLFILQNYRNVFCCVRPPGHHIGTNGAINNPNNANVSQGFCLFNNVAIAAAYARSQYPEFQRIAILDFDIHHGNGTEDCIQHLCPCVKTTVNMVDNMEVRYLLFPRIIIQLSELSV